LLRLNAQAQNTVFIASSLPNMAVRFTEGAAKRDVGPGSQKEATAALSLLPLFAMQLYSSLAGRLGLTFVQKLATIGQTKEMEILAPETKSLVPHEIGMVGATPFLNWLLLSLTAREYPRGSYETSPKIAGKDAGQSVGEAPSSSRSSPFLASSMLHHSEKSFGNPQLGAAKISQTPGAFGDVGTSEEGKAFTPSGILAFTFSKISPSIQAIAFIMQKMMVSNPHFRASEGQSGRFSMGPSRAWEAIEPMMAEESVGTGLTGMLSDAEEGVKSRSKMKPVIVPPKAIEIIPQLMAQYPNISFMMMRQPSYGLMLGGLGIPGRPGRGSIETEMMRKKSGTGEEGPTFPLQNSAKMEEPRVFPLSSTNINVSADENEGLMELERKISKILEVQMRRYYGQG
jgi:hypothetical protein